MNIGMFLNCITFISTSYHTKIGTQAPDTAWTEVQLTIQLFAQWPIFLIFYSCNICGNVYTLLHKLVCKLLHKWASWYFHEPKVSEKCSPRVQWLRYPAGKTTQETCMFHACHSQFHACFTMHVSCMSHIQCAWMFHVPCMEHVRNWDIFHAWNMYEPCMLHECH